MLFKQTYLKGSYTVHLEKYGDERFSRYWCKNEYSDLGLSRDINQINSPFNIKGYFKGLAFSISSQIRGKNCKVCFWSYLGCYCRY